MRATFACFVLLCMALCWAISVDAAAYRCRNIGYSEGASAEEHQMVRSIRRRGNMNNISGYYRCPEAEELIRRALDERTDESVREDRPSYSTVFSDIREAVLQKTRRAAHIYLVGGPVRDALQGKEPKDIDASIDVSLRTVSDALLKHTTYVPDKTKSQDFLLLIGAEDQGVDLTHVDNNVNAQNIWRDVSVNALYYDVETGVILDGTGYGIDDISTNTLRISEESTQWCRGKSIHCGAKIQRYIHMRVKGFIPRLESAQVVLPLLEEVVKEDGKDLSELQFKLAKSTFSPILTMEKRYNRFVLSRMAINSDIVTFASVHGILNRNDDPRAVADRWFWTNIAPLLFDVRCYRNGMCKISPEYGAVVPQLDCTAVSSTGFLKVISFDNKEDTVTMNDGPVKVTICKFNMKPVARDERSPIEEGCPVVLETRMELVNRLTDATTRNLRKICSGCDISQLQDDFKNLQGKLEGSIGSTVRKYDGVSWVAEELARRSVRVLAAYQEVAPQLLAYDKLYNNIESSYLPGSQQVVKMIPGVFKHQYELKMSAVQEILARGTVEQRMALAYHLLTGIPVLRIPVSKMHSEDKLSGSDSKEILAKIHRGIPGCVEMSSQLNQCEADNDMAAQYGIPQGWAFLAKYCDDKLCAKQRVIEGGKPIVSNNNLQVSKHTLPGFLLQCQGNGFLAKGGPAIEASELLALSTELLGFSDQDAELVTLALIGWLATNNGPYSTYGVLASTMGQDLARLEPVRWLMPLASVLTSDNAVKDAKESVVNINDIPHHRSTETVHTPEGFIKFLADRDVSPARMFVDLSFKKFIANDFSELLKSESICTMPELHGVGDSLDMEGIAKTYSAIIQEANDILKAKKETCNHKEDLWRFALGMKTLAFEVHANMVHAMRNLKEPMRQLRRFIETPDIMVADQVLPRVISVLEQIDVHTMQARHETLVLEMTKYGDMARKHRFRSPCKESRDHFKRFDTLSPTLFHGSIRSHSVLLSSLKLQEMDVRAKVENALRSEYELPQCGFRFEEFVDDLVIGSPECNDAQSIRRAAISLFVQSHVLPNFMRADRRFMYGELVSVGDAPGKAVVVGVTLNNRWVRNLSDSKIAVVPVNVLRRTGRVVEVVETVSSRGPVTLAGGTLLKNRVEQFQQCSKAVENVDESGVLKTRYKVPMKVDGKFCTVDVFSDDSMSWVKPVVIPSVRAAAVAKALSTISIGELVDCNFKNAKGDRLWLPGIITRVMASDPVGYKCAIDWDEVRKYEALPFDMEGISFNAEVIAYPLSSDHAVRIYSRTEDLFETNIRNGLQNKYRFREGTVVSLGRGQGEGTVKYVRIMYVGEGVVTPTIMLKVRKTNGDEVEISASSIKESYEYPTVVGSDLFYWMKVGMELKFLEINMLDARCHPFIGETSKGSYAYRNNFEEDWYPVTSLERRAGLSEDDPLENVRFVVGGIRGGNVQGLRLLQDEVAPKSSEVVTMQLPVRTTSEGPPPSCLRFAPSYYDEGAIELSKLVYQINTRFLHEKILVDIDGNGTWVPAKMSNVAGISGGGVVVPITYEGAFLEFLKFLTTSKNLDWVYVEGGIKLDHSSASPE